MMNATDKIRHLEKALIRTLLTNCELLEEMEALHNTKAEATAAGVWVPAGATETLSAELLILREDNEKLEAELNKLKCQSFPGETELLVKRGDKIVQPTKEDLRRLCDANGLVVLDEGQYFCGPCGGVRTSEYCKWCAIIASQTHPAKGEKLSG